MESAPIPMLLWCPECSTRHLDVGEFATKIHTTHACQFCGHVWRPAIVPTVGVQFLPGFKNEVATMIKEKCVSTHGAAGYASGSYWRGDKIVCGSCRTEITDPNPTGHRIYPPRPAKFLAEMLWLWDLNWHPDRFRRIPVWGDAVSGTPPIAMIDKFTLPYDD